MMDAAVNLGELVASERDRVLRFCRSKIFDKAAAEDVTQQIFVKFAQEMANSAKPIRKPKAWLTRAAKNECADYGRRLVQRRTGRRPKRKSRNDSTPKKPLRRAILLYENELPESSAINSNDEADLDPFNKVIDQAAMDQGNEDYSEEYEELNAPQVNLIGRLKRPERLAFLACGPWHLSEYDAAIFLGSKLAEKVVRARRKWPKGIPIVEASRIFSVNNGTLSSQMSRATAKLRSHLCQLASIRPRRAERPDEPRTNPIEPPAEPVANSPATALNRTSQAFARIVMEEPTKLVPGWAGTPPSRSADLPNREFSRIDQREALRKISYPCGSYFKGCKKCGDVVYGGKCKECGTMIYHTRQMKTAACTSPNCDERRSRVKLRKYYTSGYSVRKAHSPKAAGFTYWCYLCGAKDENCWEGFVGEP